jgi:DNA mismatch repair protein MLH3
MELLPESTRSKLRSTTILTSLPQVVIELVQNSLDANATTVEVGINVNDWSCWVRDDGVGINRQGLEPLTKGLEERRYGLHLTLRSSF